MCCSYLRPFCNRSKRSLAGSLRFRPGLLGCFGRLGFLIRVGFCCLLLRTLLRILLVGSFGACLATTCLAFSAWSVVFTYARPTTLLANVALSVVLAYARPTTLLALLAMSVVFTYANTTTLVAL